jgi:hypothetical protein
MRYLLAILLTGCVAKANNHAYSNNEEVPHQMLETQVKGHGHIDRIYRLENDEVICYTTYNNERLNCFLKKDLNAQTIK